MGVTRTRAGLRKCRAAEPGSRVVLVAPASGFDRAEFDRGVAELARLGFVPVHAETVFAREAMTAGPAAVRAKALKDAWASDDVAALVAVRGGYGSVETLPLLSAADVPDHPAMFVGYSDVTSLHTWLNLHVGVTSVYGAMIDGRLARGVAGYDPASFTRSLGREPVGELTADSLEVLRAGEAAGPLFGGTITQLAASLGTPYAFLPPAGSVVFLEEVGERPYRLRRLLMQLRLAGAFTNAAAIVVGQMRSCDEPGGQLTARAVIADFFSDFPGPVLFGLPAGHSIDPLISLPFGVGARVLAAAGARFAIDEAAAH